MKLKKIHRRKIGNYEKNIIIIILLLPLLTACNNSITGTYISTENDNYYLKLYNNGTCDWKWGNGIGYQTANGECKYDYNENEIIITFNTISHKALYGSELTEICTFSKKTIICDALYGSFLKEK